MKNYSANMSRDCQVLADISGIAAGWIEEIFKVGCELCGFECGGIVTPAMIRIYGSKAANRVEDHVWTRFSADAKTMNCSHLDGYNFLKSNPEKLPEFLNKENGN